MWLDSDHGVAASGSVRQHQGERYQHPTHQVADSSRGSKEHLNANRDHYFIATASWRCADLVRVLVGAGSRVGLGRARLAPQEETGRRASPRECREIVTVRRCSIRMSPNHGCS